ncbi:MAG TPA: hypothetical protein DEA32_01520 [Firmicutes bacterium]|nr:hypothetical protein [Bacillota bacterium]
MTLSLMNLIFWIGLFFLAVFLPYNSIRDLALSCIFPFIFSVGFYLLDRLLLNFRIITAVGETLAYLLRPLTTRFQVASAGLFTSLGVIFLAAIFLLLWAVFTLAISSCATGVPPWRKSRTRGLKRVCCAFIFFAISTFTVAFAIAGIREMPMVIVGFFEGFYEILFPWEVCF